MAQIQEWSTAGMAPRRCIEYWNDSAEQALTIPMTIDAQDPSSFWGRIRELKINNMDIVEVSSGPATIRHSQAHVTRMASGLMHLLMQLSGRSRFSQGGREAVLCSGDITLVDCAQPYTMRFAEPVANLVLTVHRDQMNSFIACPETFAAIGLSGSTGRSAFASRFLRELWRRPEELVANSDSHHLDRAVLGIIATAYAGTSPPADRGTSQARARKMRLMRFIEQNLHDPELRPESIAAFLHTTVRCVYRIFDGENETLAAYIRRRRIEECARDLSNPAKYRESISAIAYAHGFNSIAHFSKVFRMHIGQSPTDYRKSGSSAAARPSHLSHAG